MHNVLQFRFHGHAILRYTAAKPRGPVLETTNPTEALAPAIEGLCRAQILRMMHLLRRACMFTGGMDISVRTVTRLLAWFQHPVHPMRLKPQKVASLGSPTGIQTMTALTKQAISAAASSPTTGTLATTQISTVLAAFNAANMASSYIERGNFAAARRKLVLALASVNQLTEG